MANRQADIGVSQIGKPNQIVLTASGVAITGVVRVIWEDTTNAQDVIFCLRAIRQALEARGRAEGMLA